VKMLLLTPRVQNFRLAKSPSGFQWTAVGAIRRRRPPEFACDDSAIKRNLIHGVLHCFLFFLTLRMCRRAVSHARYTNMCYNQHSICQDSKNKLRPLNNLLCILRTLANQYKLPDLRSKQECLKTN
jgi:hypothetical protein